MKAQETRSRRYEAATIFEAYTKLKRDLGENAVIMRTRTYRKGGIMGLWGQKTVEITASMAPPRSREENGRNGPVEKAYGLRESGRVRENSAAAVAAAAAAAAEVASRAAPEAPADEGFGSIGEFKKELAEIREMVREIKDAGRFRHWPDMPQEFQKAFQKLQGFNIHEDISRALIQRWMSHYPDYKSGTRVDVGLLEKYVGEMVVPAGPIHIKEGGGPTVVMLVGPTGVGKTTTLAKLAAHYKLQEHLDVAFLTIDTYRMAAVEQLRTYADLLGLPIKVVSSPADMRSSLKMFSGRDLILIDTAGRSPFNKEKMRELKEFVDAGNPDEVHLVMSVNVNNDVMKNTLERFESLQVHKLLLTKLDESLHYGIILTIIGRTQKPIGYLTTGQEIPKDIEVATARRLSRIILGLDRIHA